jgi:hypothetical protein
VNLTDGTIDHTGDPYCALCFYDIEGSVTITSPAMITGSPDHGLLAIFSQGVFSFTDLTIDVTDGGLGRRGVALEHNGGSSFTFTNLVASMTGDGAVATGGVAFRAENRFGTGTTALAILGGSVVFATDAEEALVLTADPTQEFVLDVTLGQILATGNPLGAGVLVDHCLGSFTCSTTTIADVLALGMRIADCGADFSFTEVDVSDVNTDVEGFATGIDVVSGTGAVTIGGGTIHIGTVGSPLRVPRGGVSFATVGLAVTDASATSTDVAYTTMDVCVVLAGSVTLGGTGNSATSFGTLCQDFTTSVAGSISFGAQGSCP